MTGKVAEIKKGDLKSQNPSGQGGKYATDMVMLKAMKNANGKILQYIPLVDF